MPDRPAGERAPEGAAGTRHAEGVEMFGEYALVEPGVVHIPLWRPDSPDDLGPHPEMIGAFAGVARRE